MGMLYVFLENEKQDIATVLLTLPKQLLKKIKGKQKNDHMQFIFYNKECVCGPLRKNNMQNN